MTDEGGPPNEDYVNYINKNSKQTPEWGGVPVAVCSVREGTQHHVESSAGPECGSSRSFSNFGAVVVKRK